MVAPKQSTKTVFGAGKEVVVIGDPAVVILLVSVLDLRFLDYHFRVGQVTVLAINFLVAI